MEIIVVKRSESFWDQLADAFAKLKPVSQPRGIHDGDEVILITPEELWQVSKQVWNDGIRSMVTTRLHTIDCKFRGKVATGFDDDGNLLVGRRP